MINIYVNYTFVSTIIVYSDDGYYLLFMLFIYI